MTLTKPEIIMTTEGQNGFEVAQHLAILTAQCAFSQQAFNDAFASVQEIVDRRSALVERTLQEGVDIVMADLQRQAAALDAEAVIAITIQYTPIGFGTACRTLVSAMGTAVRFVT